MALYPTIKRGAFSRILQGHIRNVSFANVVVARLTHDVGALVRDTGSLNTAVMTTELRRQVVDPFLDLTNLSGFVRPGTADSKEDE